MRRIGFAIVTLLVGGLAGLANTTPAAAYDYAWCAQGKEWGYPGDCSYRTYAQCMARVSGTLAYCGVNPRIAFDRARRGLPAYPADPYRE